MKRTASLAKKGLRLFDKGSYRAAIAVFRSALVQDPNDIDALFYLALGLYNIKQFKRSLQYWRRFRELHPMEGSVHLNMGAAYEDLGRDDLALRYYKLELGMYPDCRTALYNVGALYYRRHQYRKAIGYLERCYQMGHCKESCVGRLARSYDKTRQRRKEMDLYLDWLQTHPKDAWALNNLGDCLMQSGELARAQIFFQRANAVNPEDEIVQRNLKKVRAMRKRRAAGIG